MQGGCRPACRRPPAQGNAWFFVCASAFSMLPAGRGPAGAFGIRMPQAEKTDQLRGVWSVWGCNGFVLAGRRGACAGGRGLFLPDLRV